ncbi:MAG: hypothetical protein HY298_12830 [Verrucomicrobia bacterium]|nr:hypothetical protein [Verrucomicrobiota bacterium]
MRAFASLALTVLLMGCASPRKESSAKDESPLPFLADRQRQLHEAAKRAEAAGDFRPYPDGWPEGTLPLRRDPNIAKSIQLGQTLSEVTAIMGREGWSHTETRRQFLKRIRDMYKGVSSSRKLPQEFHEIEEQLPRKGKFVYWQYQGYSSTADWIVVFFATSPNAPESEPRVIARGVFRLGCLF